MIRLALPARLSLAALALLLIVPVAATGQETITCEPGTRLFEHDLLVNPVCLPGAPQRIAFIDDNIMSALELDIPSVTRSYYSDIIVADFPPHGR